MDGQGTIRHRNIAENFNPLSIGRTNVTDDGQTDGRTMTYSEREHEFTFAKNGPVFIAHPLVFTRTDTHRDRQTDGSKTILALLRCMRKFVLSGCIGVRRWMET